MVASQLEALTNRDGSRVDAGMLRNPLQTLPMRSTTASRDVTVRERLTSDACLLAAD